MQSRLVGFANVGRSHHTVLPQLGLVKLINIVNRRSTELKAEYFDYTDLRSCTITSDHLTLFHLLSYRYAAPVWFMPELPILDLLLEEVRRTPSGVPSVAEITQDKAKLDFICRFCDDHGTNVVWFFEMLEQLFGAIEQRILPELSRCSLVGFYCVSANFMMTVLTSEIVRKRLRIPTMAGGPQVTAAWKYLAPIVESGSFFDGIVEGDAEDRIIDICEDVLGRKRRTFEMAPLRGMQSMVNEPFDFDCVLDKDYKYNCLLYDLSCGCPLSCTFCAENTIHRRLATRDPIYGAREIIRLAKRHRCKTWRIADSLININDAHVSSFCEELARGKSRSLNRYARAVQFYGYLAAPVSEGLAKELAAAGMRIAWVGVESFSDLFLEGVQKRVRVADIFGTIGHLLQAGIRVRLLMMTPMPEWMDVAPDFVYAELSAFKAYARELIKSGLLQRKKVDLSLAAHSPTVCLLNSTMHNRMESDGRVESFEHSDFFRRDVNPYPGAPKQYVQKTDNVRWATMYYHIDSVLERMLPLNGESDPKTLETTLPFRSFGKAYGSSHWGR